MEKQHTKDTASSSGNAAHTEHAEELLRLARRLDNYRDLEQLLRALPAELGSVIACNTTALVYEFEGTVSWHVAETGGAAAPPPLRLLNGRKRYCPWSMGIKKNSSFYR